jgi:nucleoside-diphosphate-sugar epimerase
MELGIEGASRAKGAEANIAFEGTGAIPDLRLSKSGPFLSPSLPIAFPSPAAISHGNPGTWFTRDGDVGQQVLRREVPVIGKGEGIWNWVHIDDAAAATCAALTADPGVYNVVGDQPVAQSVWLPAFAQFVGAPEPPTVSEEQALRNAGPDTVYYATKLRGASNQKAKGQLAFRPRPLEWLGAQTSAAV